MSVTQITSAVVAQWTAGIYEQGGIGFAASNSFNGSAGSASPNTYLGQTIINVGQNPHGSPWYAGQVNGVLLLLLAPGSVIPGGSILVVTPPNLPPQYYNFADAGIYGGSSGVANTPANSVGYSWTAQSANMFVTGNVTTLGLLSPPTGHGDFPNPEAWTDGTNIPPAQFQNVPQNVNFPLNGDGRYWFTVDALTPQSGPIYFIGDPTFFTGLLSLQWSITQAATDGSTLNLAYSTDGTTYTTVAIGPQIQLKSIQNGVVQVPINGVQQLFIQVTATGGTPSSTATPWQVALAITRNNNEAITWDSPNPFNPVNYNCECMDNVVPTDTMADLQSRIMVRLGFSNQASNPPPGMAALVQDFLSSGQKYLYRRYSQLHTKRMFRWKVNPGQRFYSLQDNDEDVLCGFTMDPMKAIEWAGIQDTRNVWYPLIQGIPPQLYTMITKPWRPARYEIRQCIELYPMPDQTYFLWFRAHFGLMSFAAPTDTTTIDSELVFLHALANAKAHYGQPDANNIEAQANAYRAELIAGTHQTAHYIPGTIAVPPAVRPTLIQFSDQQSG